MIRCSRSDIDSSIKRPGFTTGSVQGPFEGEWSQPDDKRVGCLSRTLELGQRGGESVVVVVIGGLCD